MTSSDQEPQAGVSQNPVQPAAEALLEFLPETGLASQERGAGPFTCWRVLVIDDDADVHQATRFSLEHVRLFDRPLVLLHARSAAEAKALLAHEPDIALILLDVVMETAAAGLDLVSHIREAAGMRATRIVLRTAQPGYAPEHETLLTYDINDYKTKSELTHHKLLATVTSAVRAYQQLRELERSRQGLASIVDTASQWLPAPDVAVFAANVLAHTASVLNTPVDGLVWVGNQPEDPGRVLAACGQWALAQGQLLSGVQGPLGLPPLPAQAWQEQVTPLPATDACWQVGADPATRLWVYVRAPTALDAVTRQLLQVLGVQFTALLTNQLLLQRLRTEAYVDRLLRLPNRTRFVEMLNESVAAGHGGDVVLLVDIDDFASVNDLMGHGYGDSLLRAVADHLAHGVGAGVRLARVSGNTFGLLGPAAALDPVRTLALFDNHLLVHGQPQRVSVTMGLCAHDGPDTEGADWLKDASIALKQAKRDQRGGCVRFSRQMALHARNRAQLLSRLHTAFDHDHLFLAYQPQVDLGTKALIGLEVLMRWRGDDGQPVPPDTFIPVAEQSGLIVGLGEWVFRTACLTMRQLLEQGLAPRRMAVNVSVVQFQSTGFIDRLQQAVAMAGIEPQHLELEITESVALMGPGVVEPMLRRLRDLGYSVAIDDFGTGYSSLSYLERLPLDRIKIDKAFVIQMSRSGGPRIAELIAQLGIKLGMRVLAEGIEDAEAWRMLQTMGVHEGQGYYIAAPMDLDKLKVWLRAYGHGLST